MTAKFDPNFEESTAEIFPATNCLDANLATICEGPLNSSLIFTLDNIQLIGGIRIFIDQDEKKNILGATVRVGSENCGTVTNQNDSIVLVTCGVSILGSEITFIPEDSKKITVQEIEILVFESKKHIFLFNFTCSIFCSKLISILYTNLSIKSKWYQKTYQENLKNLPVPHQIFMIEDSKKLSPAYKKKKKFPPNPNILCNQNVFHCFTKYQWAKKFIFLLSSLKLYC